MDAGVRDKPRKKAPKVGEVQFVPIFDYHSKIFLEIWLHRTSDNDVQVWDDAQDLDFIVVDKRAHKRANGAKRRRRNRRYENRLLNSQLDNYSL